LLQLIALDLAGPVDHPRGGVRGRTQHDLAAIGKALVHRHRDHTLPSEPDLAYRAAAHLGRGRQSGLVGVCRPTTVDLVILGKRHPEHRRPAGGIHDQPTAIHLLGLGIHRFASPFDAALHRRLDLGSDLLRLGAGTSQIDLRIRRRLGLDRCRLARLHDEAVVAQQCEKTADEHGDQGEDELFHARTSSNRRPTLVRTLSESTSHIVHTLEYVQDTILPS